MLKVQFAAYDRFLYALKSSIFSKHGWNVRIELRTALRTMSSRYTFEVAVVNDVRISNESGMDLFMDYTEKLGSIKGPEM